MLKLGIIVNPYAGIGGSVALKGSDGAQVRDQALSCGAALRAAERMQRALQPLKAKADVMCLGFSGAMGEATAQALGLAFRSLGQAATEPSTEQDTYAAAKQLLAEAVDLIVFAGGDGTARVLADAVGSQVPVLGVPAGVKIHSGVYANTPEEAGRVLANLACGHWAPLAECEVRDIDEAAFREGRVRARHYADMNVPMLPGAIQEVKQAGAPTEDLVQLDIAADIAERLEDDTLYLLGPGSTTRAISNELGIDSTLLGADLLMGKGLLALDVTEADILQALQRHQGPVVLIVTVIGGQGHVFGRGNQQFSPQVIRAVGIDNIWIVATPDKLKALDGRPLQVDTNDPQLDDQLAGLMTVTCGYHQQLLYPVGVCHDAA